MSEDVIDFRDERPARLDPGLSGGRALVIVGIIAALVAGVYLWLSRPRPEPASGGAGPPSAAGTVASVLPTARAPGPSAPAGGRLVVQVAGKVRRPGVFTLPAGSRVADAIKAAGGLRPGAGTGALNLARTVVDGEQIMVGVKVAAQPAPPPGGGASAGTGPPGAPGAPGVPGAGAAGTPIDLNTATVAQFQELPGVGPVLAQRIIDYRTQHGGFRSVDELQEVSGIGDKRFAELRQLVRV